MRITLVHALKHSIVPVEAAFAKLWPEARLMNLLDDSLSADLARGRNRRRWYPFHLLGLWPLHRSRGPRARADAGAQTQ